jgi:hypothetical protein
MWAYFFSLILVGLPAAAGAFIVIRKADSHSLTNGATIIVYAAALAFVFAYYIPEGRLMRAPYALIMPAVLIAGLIVGGIAAFLRSRRNGLR